MASSHTVNKVDFVDTETWRWRLVCWRCLDCTCLRHPYWFHVSVQEAIMWMGSLYYQAPDIAGTGSTHFRKCNFQYKWFSLHVYTSYFHMHYQTGHGPNWMALLISTTITMQYSLMHLTWRALHHTTFPAWHPKLTLYMYISINYVRLYIQIVHSMVWQYPSPLPSHPIGLTSTYSLSIPSTSLVPYCPSIPADPLVPYSTPCPSPQPH